MFCLFVLIEVAYDFNAGINPTSYPLVQPYLEIDDIIFSDKNLRFMWNCIIKPTTHSGPLKSKPSKEWPLMTACDFIYW